MITLATARNLATHAAAAVAFLALAQGGAYPPWFDGLFAVLLLLTWLKGDRSPGWLSWPLTILTAGLGLGLMFLTFRAGLDGVVAFGAFCATLTLNRLIARHGPADDPAIYLTSVLMLTSGAALTGDLAYALWFVSFALILTIGLTLSHLDREADQAQLSENARRALLTGPLLRALGALGLASLLMVGAFFALFPRINGYWFGRRTGLTPDSLLGFKSTVELGGQGVLRDDPRPALRIRLPEMQKRAEAAGEALPARLDLLLRGQSLDTFDGRRWSMANQAKHFIHGAPPAHFSGLHAEIDVLPVSDAALIFSPGHAVAAQVFSQGSGPPLHLQRYAGGDISVDPRPSGPYHFEVWTDAEPSPTSLAHLGTKYPDEIRDRDLQLPDHLDPRVAQLAQTWTRGLTDPLERATAILNHLHRDFTYTAVRPKETADPLAYFLFERKMGHCEFFSTAMVILLRTLGIPARDVMGFLGGDLAPGGDYYLARAGSAHSWAEVYFPDLGYVTFDPTPASYRDQSLNTVRAYLIAALDVVEKRWEASVVDYNLISQKQLVAQASQAMKSALERFRRPESGHLEVPWAFLLAALGFTGAIFGLRRQFRSARSGAGTGATDAASLAYQGLTKALRKRGLARADTETPREFAQRVAHLRRPEAAHVWELTRLHERARYGGATWSPADVRRARELVRTLPRADVRP